MAKGITNREFAKTDEKFQEVCARAGLPNHKNVIHTRKGRTTITEGAKDLTRQASKWRMGKGLAFANRFVKED